MIRFDGLTSLLAGQSTMCVRKKSKQFFYGVKSSSSSPGAPGYIVTDFTPDRNKHLKETLPAFKLLRFCRTLVTLFPSNMHVQLAQHFCLVPLLSHFITSVARF